MVMPIKIYLKIGRVNLYDHRVKACQKDDRKPLTVNRRGKEIAIPTEFIVLNVTMPLNAFQLKTAEVSIEVSADKSMPCVEVVKPELPVNTSWVDPSSVIFNCNTTDILGETQSTPTETNTGEQ